MLVRIVARQGAVLSLPATNGESREIFLGPSDDFSQYRLQFRSRSGAMPEGTYALDCGWCTEQLFLQPGIEGPVACINRLLPFKN